MLFSELSNIQSVLVQVLKQCVSTNMCFLVPCAAVTVELYIPAVIGWHFLSNATLSNTASFVFYGITCPIRLIYFAALFDTFEESLR